MNQFHHFLNELRHYNLKLGMIQPAIHPYDGVGQIKHINEIVYGEEVYYD